MRAQKIVFSAIAVFAFAVLVVWSGCGDNNIAGPAGGYVLTTGSLPSAGGSVSRNITRASYKAGTSVTVAASANPGYEFVRWSGASASADDTVTVTMSQNLTLIADFKRIVCAQKSYTVSFNTAGGIPSSISPVTVDCGGTLDADFPAKPVKDGHDFGAWFDGATGTVYTAQTVITKNVTLTAEWIMMEAKQEIKSFTVSFNANGGSPNYIDPVTVDSGTALGEQFPEDPERAGYAFDGWFDGVAQYTAQTVIAKDVMLTAKWAASAVEAARFTVSFVTNGGTPAAIAPVTVDSGAALGAQFPEDPERAGYAFNGWFDGVAQYTASTAIVKDVALTAKWAEAAVKITRFTVSFNANGGTPAAIAPVTVDSGTALGAQFPEDPAKTGHKFGGWFDGTARYTASTVIAKDLALTAKWTETVTVSFNTNGGIPAVIAPVTIDIGDALWRLFPENPTRSGHYFIKWVDTYDVSYVYTENMIILKDLELIAVWGVLAPKRFSVSFEPNGGSPSTISSVFVDSGASLGSNMPADPTRPGYDFVKWTEMYSTNVYTASTAITKHVELIANWISNIKSVTVTFNANGGSPSIISSVTVDSGSSLGLKMPADPKNTGYRFDGWFFGADEYTSSSVITKDITLTAKWGGGQYKVSFIDPSSASGSQNHVIIVDSGATLSKQQLKGAIRQDFTFGGWFSGTQQYTESTVITKDVTLVAKWRCTVTFSSNGGTDVASVVVDSGSKFGSITPAAPTRPNRPGNVFAGWWSEGDRWAGEHTANTVITKNVTLTAMWKVKIDKLTWMADNLNIPIASSYCYNGNGTGNCDIYGSLYHWSDVSKMCPAGWHLPSNDEWDALVKYAGGASVAGAKLKAKTSWKSTATANGTDDYDFMALAGGYGATNGYFYDLGVGGYWWSSDTSIRWVMLGKDSEVNKVPVNGGGFYSSIRCVQN